MNRLYYFLVASLPTLDFGVTPPISSNDLLDKCHRELTKDELDILTPILTQDEADIVVDHDLFKKCQAFNHHLRNEIAYFRSQRAGKDPALYLRGERLADPFFVEVINQAAKSINPLEAEKILDRQRWQFLDDVGRFEYFSFNFLVTYALKLIILERYEAIGSPQGRAVFEQYKKIEITIG